VNSSYFTASRQKGPATCLESPTPHPKHRRLPTAGV
jgi:hypothetical protein